MHPLEEKIIAARKNNRLAIIPFITAGFPTKDKFWDILLELDQSGADIIEVGVPFSDPVADGPVVEEASRRALNNGITLEEILEGLTARKAQIKTPIVLMGYYNPFLQYGLEKLVKDAKAANVSGFIVPDLPYEEAKKMRDILHENDIALVPLVGLNTNEDRMRLYASDAKGYVYVVSVMGTTGERKNIPPDVAQKIDLARKIFNVPIALGFGLKTPSQLDSLPEASRPDAVVFGSALLKHIDSGKKAREFLTCWL